MPKIRRFNPSQILALSFLGAICLGTLLLMLPWSTQEGRISFIDALFTSTSAVCVTGLIVKDTPTFFSPWGQAIIMLLFQMGGLGIMTFSTLILLVSGRKISITDRLIIQEGFHYGFLRDWRSLIKKIFLFTFFIELGAGLILFLRWRVDFPWPKALFISLFHAISAFCNAGFSLFSQSLLNYRHDVVINLTMMATIVLGGLGFLVLQEGFYFFGCKLKRTTYRLSLHTRLVLTMTSLLILLPALVLLGVEWSHSLAGYNFSEKLLASFFQVITARTAGFNTLDLTSLSYGSVFLLIALMFTGASPGSTGGGVKTTTMGVVLAFLRSKLLAREEVLLYRRTIPSEVITRAFTLVTLAIFFISGAGFLLFLVQPHLSMDQALFEVFSAFGTVGLSLGGTASLNTGGKIIIIITMFVGRIGLLTLLYALSREKAFGKFTYVEESVMIG
ncbi:MAG TPA: hypothetical protein ENF17_05745 [Candidatus Aminicenantes bacterium]|nr:hypothetical protein [Candidatus Aminicenantes bacterium]